MQPKKTKLLFINPVLDSTDVARDIKWYEENLGFKNVYDSSEYQEGRPIDYAVLGRDQLYLHLQFQYPKDAVRSDVKIQVQNISPLIEEFITKGLITEERVSRKTAWNTCEFGLFDLNRNRIFFFEDL